MDHRHLAHLDADPDFYDNVWNHPAADADLLGPTVVPGCVTVRDYGPWRTYLGTDRLPGAGWKIHVGARPERATEIVARSVGVALELGMTCKHLRTRSLVSSTQAKYAPTANAGKVVTIYPADEKALDRVLEQLTRVLAGERAARVLSDIPIAGTPLSLRYGAFRGAYFLTERDRVSIGRFAPGGEVEEDARLPGAGFMPGVAEPAVVTGLRKAAQDRDEQAVLPVTEVRVMHRSNAGGVYEATWRGGARAVLKEARANTGYDASGSDAVTRLRHERRVLERLEGTGVAPRVLEYLTVGDSEFLVMEHVEGALAAARLATGHPAAVPGAEVTDHLRWVERIVELTGHSLTLAHTHGVVHRDVHPGNVIERDGRAVLIDFESAALDGQAVAIDVATPLSNPGAEVSCASDMAALERMRLFLLTPQYALTARRPELAEVIVTAGLEDLGLTPPSYPSDQLRVARLEAGLHLAATPSRGDRLFPGDVTALGDVGGCMGILHGAAGVLEVLRVLRMDVPEEWHAWLVNRALDAPLLAPGVGSGAEGVALCLARAGEHEAAHRIVKRWGDRPSATPWWAEGAAGRAVACAELAVLLEDERAWDLVAVHVARAQAWVRGSAHPAGHSAGFLHGWAGVGLALLRVRELLDLAGRGASDNERLLDTAHRALERETEYLHVRGEGHFTTDGARSLPYLGTGAAALGVLAAVLEREFPRVQTLRNGVSRSLRLPAVAGGGLMQGRAGMVAALTLMDPDDPAIALHRSRLAWYLVPVSQSSRGVQPGAEAADFFLGDQNLRCSADLATGAAGAMLVSHGTPSDAAGVIAQILCLPRRLPR